MLTKVVQYHRRTRIHIAPEPESSTRASRAGEGDNTSGKTATELDYCQVGGPRGLAADHSYQGKAVVPGEIGGIRVSQTLGTRPGTLLNKFPPEIQTGVPPPPGRAPSGGIVSLSRTERRTPMTSRISRIAL
jgi:hypothetical protein